MRRSARYIAALLLAVSCNEALMENPNMGSISLVLSSDVEVVADTKADDIDYGSFLVKVSGAQDWFDGLYSEIPVGGVTVPFGSYVVEAQSCTESAAVTANDGFGCVRYKGSENVEVQSNEPSSVTVKCPMVNAKASLTFDESFLEDFSEPSAFLKVGDRTVELENASEAASRVTYFNVDGAETLYYTVSGIVAGRTLSYSGHMSIAPAKWAKIIIRSNHNGQIGGPDISVDGDMDDDSYTVIIDPDTDFDNVDGDVTLPSIIVDASIDDATVIDCYIDIY